MSEQELKPCPFCGDRIGVRLRQPWAFNPQDPRHKDWIVDCDDCGAESGPFNDADNAVKFWNRRPTMVTRVAKLSPRPAPPLLTDEQMPPLPNPSFQKWSTGEGWVIWFKERELRDRDRAVEAAVRRQILGESAE